MYLIVNKNIWSKIDLLRAMWLGASNARAYIATNGLDNNPLCPTNDDLEYALGEYSIIDNKILISNIDGRIIKPNRDGGCRDCDYIHYRGIKTSFYDWPILDNYKYNRYYGDNALENIINIKEGGLIKTNLKYNEAMDIKEQN